VIALEIGPKRQLEAASATCCRCGQLLRRGYLVRHVDGQGEAHVDCLPSALGCDVLHALDRLGPAIMSHVARQAGIGTHAASTHLRRLLNAGFVRKAGDFWRINNEYPNLKAALAAWRSHDPS
jgi:hypothetical protein